MMHVSLLHVRTPWWMRLTRFFQCFGDIDIIQPITISIIRKTLQYTDVLYALMLE